VRPKPVEHPHFLEYQVSLVLSLAAAGLSIKRFQGHDLSFLMLDYRVWPEEPWRLLTCCLLHGNYVHLIFNLYWTLRFGYLLEPVFGTVAMLAIFVFLGAVSSAAQWAISGPCIGLSGIGYGLFGLAWALDRYHPSYRGIMDERTTVAFVIWFFLCIAATLTHTMPVANTAHGAGALLGGLLGLSLSPFPKRHVLGRAGLVALTSVILLASTVGRPYVNFSDARAWELAYDGYVALEREDLPAAQAALERSTEVDPDGPYAWHNLGVVYARLHRMDDAESAFRRAEAVEAEEAARREERKRPFFDLLPALDRRD
jgi:membrane associated rhomboid family serine protease